MDMRQEKVMATQKRMLPFMLLSATLLCYSRCAVGEPRASRAVHYCLERMGGRSSKQNEVIPNPISTTVTVHTTVPTTVCTPVPTSADDLKASGVNCWIDKHEIVYILLALISGILLTVLVFAFIYLFRKKCKRSHQHLQGQAPSQTVAEESEKSIQNEVAYTTLVFQRSRAPVAV